MKFIFETVAKSIRVIVTAILASLVAVPAVISAIS